MIPRPLARTLAAASALLALAACGGEPPQQQAAAGVVNVYSSRHYASDKTIFAAFTAETGIEVNLVEGMQGDQLIERLKAEGSATAADLVLTVDAGNLHRLTEQGLLQPTASPTLHSLAPGRLRGAQDEWVALSKRARVIAYAPDRVRADEVDSYADLAAPSMKGRVCARSSTNVYNLSLLAGMIERAGAEAAFAWAKAVAGNFAREPQGGDTEQLRAVAAGACDAALVNHYYLIRLIRSADPADQAVAAKLKLSFPDQDGAGAHVNVSGGGVSAYAQNKSEAVRLLEFFLSETAQNAIVAENLEFPVREGVALPAELAAYAPFKEDETPLAALGARQNEAQKLFDRAGWR